MMNKKENSGFTLIELLAVIVILAIVAIIAVPSVINVIEDARKGSFKNSVYGIIKAAEYNHALKTIKDSNPGEIKYTYANGKESSTQDDYKLEYKGQKPKDGTIVINEEGQVSLALHDGTYCVEKGYSDSEVTLTTKTTDECKIATDAFLPSLGEGMIPIKWDGSKWIKADINSKWYDYDAKEWANVVLVTEATRNTYKNASAGTSITEADVLAYLVWIPRYRYKLFNVGATVMSAQTIEIEFEDKNTPKATGSTNGTWLTHPAFTFGSDELTGFWVGKFETTGNATRPTVKPGVASLRSQSVSNQFATAQKFNTQVTYGLPSTYDAHMMKNMEWGAVTYLSHSKYGKNAEIWKNPSSGNITGCAGTSVSPGSSSGCSYHYTTSNGQQASTTGNVYGIYDMSGGAYDRVMGGMYNSGNTTIMLSGSGFAQATIDGAGMEKYIDKYTYGTTYNDQIAINRRKLGDATGETRRWYSDSANFVYPSYPWFYRGDYYGAGAGAGAFNFSYYSGGSSIYTGFRLAVSGGNVSA